MEPRSYKTRQREAILACFASQPNASLTAAEVHQALLAQGQDIGRTTVYRTVSLLLKAGQLVAVQEGPAPLRYQHRGQKQQHISVRCQNCGSIADLTCDAVNHFETHLKEDHGFILQEEKCLLPGLCRDCQTPNNETAPAKR